MQLFEQLCRPINLRKAWEQIEQKGAAGGIDRTSVKAFADGADEYLLSLQQDLMAGSYTPEPYLAVNIPKHKGKSRGVRQLGLSSVRDKIVQFALKELLYPILDAQFLNMSYAYRRGKSTYKAVQRVRHLIRSEKRYYLVQCDIDDYFDSIDHERLIQRLEAIIPEPAVISLIRLFIRMAKVGKSLKWQAVKRGVPQGNILSPLLANLYLHDLDLFVQQHHYGMVRYADDFVILVQREEEAKAALGKIEQFLLQNLALKLNPEKKVTSVEKGFHFLGVEISGQEALVDISPDRLQRLKETMGRDFILRRNHLHPVYIGKLKTLRHYYGQLLPQATLERIDEALQQVLIEKLRLQIDRKRLRLRDCSARLLYPLPLSSEKYNQARKEWIKTTLQGAKKRSPEAQKQSVQQKIQQKKREYRRKADQARELLVKSPGTFLGKSQGQVSIRKQGKVLQKLPFKQLQHITVMARGTTLSSDLLYQCAQHHIPLNFLKANGRPFCLMLYPQGQSARIGMAQLKAYQNDKAKRLARVFVSGKIRNQINLLKYLAKYSSSKKKAFPYETRSLLQKMEKALAEIKRCQAFQLEALRAKLMLIEARAAAAYWSFWRLSLKKRLDFPGRRHRGATDPVNSALNYGYGILYGRIWEAVSQARLQPNLSYLHSPGEGQKGSLVFDLIEEFRVQAVDRPIMSMIRKGQMPKTRGGKLTDASRNQIASRVITRLSKTERFRGKELSLHGIILLQSKNLASYLLDQVPQYRPYLRKW